ncbi:hypothetical protein A3709_20850 [Halioglobus sp. HI00S01]|nr:hypothetical protein A3709_20850 [Halioglobus sp. HI00S01]
MFGDSLSAGYASWATLLTIEGYAHVRNTARGGKRMVDLEVPGWLRCSRRGGYRNDEVIIWLGSNDAFTNVQMPLFRTRLIDALQILQGRGCFVYMALPPRFEAAPALDESIPSYRDTILGVTAGYDNVEIWDIPHPGNMTFDGIHQTLALQRQQFLWVKNKLGISEDDRATGFVGKATTVR